VNLKFKARTKAMAFADNLMLAVRGDSVRAVENYSNGELSEITARAKRNKIRFNNEKSEVLLVSRRKRKEPKAIQVYLKDKILKQVTTIKYLGIIIDKLKFKEHITYVAERCTKLIHNLSRSAKLTWGLKHEALKTIYKRAILPLLPYGAPVWIDAMKYEHNKQNYIRVQWLINIRMTKAYQTMSSKALCTLTGITPIIIRTEVAVKQYNIRKSRGNQTPEIDNVVELKDWTHPADTVIITEAKDYKDKLIQVYTDGSKCKTGVGSGAVIFIGQEIATQIKLKLDSRCSNNQSEQLAIIKALETIESINTTDNNTHTATVFTDSRITLDSLHNANNHTYLIEEIRKRLSRLEGPKWKIEFLWVKSHAGIYGNEITNRLAKEAARSKDNKTAFNRIPISTLYSELEEEAKQQWQKEWKKCTKAVITKEYFPTVQERLSMNIRATPNIAAMATGHGKTRAYLRRFKLLDNATCVCKQGDQTIDHLLYQCKLLEKQRGTLKKNIVHPGHWPTSKQELITKFRKPFITFIESIDFDLL